MGLEYKLISREEIVSTVNGVHNADAPGDIFAAIANSYDETWLLGFLVKNASVSASGLPIRVILGLCYQKFIDQAISTEKFAKIYGGLLYASFDLQDNMIGEVGTYSKTYSGTELAAILAGRWPMLSIYKEFKLTNYDHWSEIDDRIDEAIQTEQHRINIRDQRFSKTRNKKITRMKVKGKIAIAVLLLFVIFLTIVNYQLLTNIRPVTIFNIKVSELTVWQVNIAAAILLVRACYEFWKRWRTR